MGQRDGGVPLEQQHRHRLADDVRAAHHQRARSLQGSFGLVEQAEDSGRRAGPQPLAAGEERAGVDRAEAVHVFLRRERVEHRPGVDLSGQRQLHEHAVDRPVAVELPDQLEQRRLRGLLGEDVLEAGHASFLTGLRLAAHVDLRRRIVSDPDESQPRPHAGALLDLPHLRGDLGADPGGDGLAVDDHGGGDLALWGSARHASFSERSGTAGSLSHPALRRRRSIRLARPCASRTIR